jgi:GT2 family glycosyltransferase
VGRILANPDADFELIVVDQSSGGRSELAPTGMGGDPRVRWIQTSTNGLSVSRNIGLSLARAPLVAFTDDDCEVPPDWLASVRREFQADSSIDMLFGAVAVPPADGKGYAAQFEPGPRAEYCGRLPDIRSPWGIGANMAFRREVFDKVGGFDELLGAGAAFCAGEETDLTIRALARGCKAVFTPDVRVLHLGLRHGSDASRLMRGYGIGLGAALAKHRRLRTRDASELLLSALKHHAGRSVRNLLRGDRHPGFGLTAAILLGALRSHRLAVDGERSLFIAQ